MRDPERLQLERGQARALQQRARLVHPDVRDPAPLRRSPDRADGGAVAAGREAAGVAMGEDPGGGRHELRRVRAHPPAALDLLRVDPPGALAGRVATHLVERPAEVDGRRSRRRERLVGLVEIGAARGGERHPVGGGDADRGRAAHREHPDRVGELRRVTAAELAQLVRQPALVEDDDGVVLEPDDPLGIEVAEPRARHRASYVPSSQEARYLACSSVSSSIAMPIVASLSRAISSSISFGTT